MKTLSICYIGLLACLTKCALSAVVTSQSAIKSSVAIGSEDGPNINETYILKYLIPQTRTAAILRTPIKYHSGSKDPAYVC